LLMASSSEVDDIIHDSTPDLLIVGRVLAR
jgi:hypothetical protein